MNFTTVKQMVAQLGLEISHEDAEEQLVVVHDESRGISNMIVDCEESIVILEQKIGDLKGDPYHQADQIATGLSKLMKLNRHLVHGAFALDEDGQTVLFRDTLALENLDLNELEGSFNALTLGLTEFGSELIEIVA